MIYGQISFEKYVFKHLISLSSFLNHFQKNDTENVPTQIHDFERWLCAQTQWIYVVETFYMSQINPKNPKLLHIKFNHHTLPVTPFQVFNLEPVFATFVFAILHITLYFNNPKVLLRYLLYVSLMIESEIQIWRNIFGYMNHFIVVSLTWISSTLSTSP